MTRKTYCGNLLWQSGLTLLARMPLRIGWESARANAVPAAALWLFALCLVLAHRFVPAASAALESVRSWQETYGWRAVVASRIVFNGLVPGAFLLCVRSIRPRRPFVTIFAQTVFGCAFGLFCDAFFRLQSAWFGTGIPALLLKTAVDQFVWTVLVISPINALFFFWASRDFSFERTRLEWPRDGVVRELVMPNLVANWFVFIPVALTTYLFPLDLQIHVNGLVGAFWTLLCLQIGARSGR